MPNTAKDIVIRDARFTWTDSGTTAETPCTEEFSLSITEEVRFKGAGLHLIHGPTACGKTSLLMALLGEGNDTKWIASTHVLIIGEMHHMPLGRDSVFYGPRDHVGGIAYVAQEPWILQETVRVRIFDVCSVGADRV